MYSLLLAGLGFAPVIVFPSQSVRAILSLYLNFPYTLQGKIQTFLRL